MFTEDDFCEGMQIARPGVVTQSLPAVQDARFRSERESGEIGKPAQPLIIIRQNSGDLSLLKHKLRYQDRVGVGGPAPRQVPPVSAIPGKESAAEGADVLWRNQR